MITFGLDTAGKTAAVALMQGEALLYESFLNSGFTHSESLLPLVDGAFKATGLAPADVELWGVCSGPGSFTGLRIGLAAVKGLAFGSSAGCAPVSTLEALAYGCPAAEGTVIAALDARRGEVYWAAFALGTQPARLTPDAASPLASLAPWIENCKKPLFFVGDGAALCYNSYGTLPGVRRLPSAFGLCRGAAVCLAARRMERESQCVAAAQLVPSYHRLSQAERERAQRLEQQGR